MTRLTPARRAAAAILLPLLAGPVAAALPAHPDPPRCPAHAPASTRAPESAPTTGDGCVAAPTATVAGPAPARPARHGRPEDATGYRHLGAVTSTAYAGVSGALDVTDPGVRAGSNDFVATRFMALGDADGRAQWLEAGWTSDGWRDADTEAIYTYDTVHMAWSYYGQYPVKPGDRVYLTLQSGATDAAGTDWSAWLWWDNQWNLLATQRLPIAERATIEQYVEVYVDPSRGGGYPVPETGVHAVELQANPGDGFRPWISPTVSATESPSYPGYCVDWNTRYDDWSAGTC